MKKIQKKVIIVGAGIGGLASALRLLSKGYEVVIYEKNDTVGGVVNQIKQDGYTFDLTATLTLIPQNFSQLFEELNLKNNLEIIPNQLLYRVFTAKGEILEFSSDLAQLTKMLESISKEESIGYLNLMTDIYEKYQFINEHFITKPFEKVGQFFNLENMKNILKIHPVHTIENYICKFLESEVLQNYLCFQSMYIGSSPYDTTDAYILLPGATQFYGLPYFKGGMYSFVKQLENSILDLGGKIYYNKMVNSLLVDGKIVKGVRIGDDCDYGDIVLANSHTFELKENLLENEDKLTCSVFILYLGIRKKLPQLNIHNIYMGDDFKENIQMMFKGNLPDKPSLYIYCPSRLDSSMAPEGCESLNIMMRVPNLTSKISWNHEVVEMLKQKIYHILEHILNFETLKDYVEVEQILTPKDLELKFGEVKGCAFGLGHHLWQTNYFRPHYHSEKYKNLYYVGASNHPGTGISLVLNSAKLVVEEIDEHI